MYPPRSSPLSRASNSPSSGFRPMLRAAPHTDAARVPCIGICTRMCFNIRKAFSLILPTSYATTAAVRSPDLHPRVFAQDHHIPGADLYPVLKLADLDDLRRLRFLLRSVGQHYPACFLLFALDHLDQSALAQWLELHIPFSFVGWLTRLKLRVGRRFIKRGGAPSPGRGILGGVPALCRR